MAIRSYRDLEAWKLSMQLAEGCCRFTEGFPKQELFGLAAHIRKSAVSIPSNVAEGHSRRSRAAYAAFISIAMGSQAELETQIELARRLGYGREPEAIGLLESASEVGRILHGLWTALGRGAAASPVIELRVPKVQS
jgi:four helix bundle protein